MRPGVVFTMKYPDNEGYVWRTIAAHRDLVSRELGSSARCYVAYPSLTNQPAYEARWAEPIAIDFYDYSSQNRQRIESVVQARDLALAIMTGADWESAGVLQRLGVRTVNTENHAPIDQMKVDPLPVSATKYILRTLFNWRVHDVHVPNSPTQLEFLVRYAKLPRSRLELIPDGVDTDHFLPPDPEAGFPSVGLDRTRLWIMTASQARSEKRIEFVIEAARRLLSQRPDSNISFFHVGAGGRLEDWRRNSIAAGLEKRYLFMGKQTEMLPWFQAASVFAHASLRETFGLAVVEAMSCGLPVVATRSGGTQETVVHGQTGFMLEQDDMNGFVEALLTYVDGPELRKSHGMNGRERAVGMYSIRRQARDFANMLRVRFPEILK